ncbi:hypothetical protein NEIMUCOT_06681 [Neisseria mucosa ATCC 25996]|uniref:Uncharacterized protein n=1 Tax=Neisseria mucosa (strain ATCC 25996 / DSM 4631 / NCTC 10774 / M26) TaxID=546266 RepID=D3A187_NEIM2|nr:hypothetical protein NEIMUCOT_06681 [Neisseria mucosa ATCC 25996]
MLILHRFNTQPPEGGWFAVFQNFDYCFSFNTQPPEGGWPIRPTWRNHAGRFQHTAARRRLGLLTLIATATSRFNTQPPEGGWLWKDKAGKRLIVSTHSRPKAAGSKPALTASSKS